jgi:hypothetical protein
MYGCTELVVDLYKLKQLTTATSVNAREMLRCAQAEINYQTDICNAVNGVQMEILTEPF